MAISPIFKKAYWSLAAAGGLYFVFLALLLNESIQRQWVWSLGALHSRVDRAIAFYISIRYLRPGNTIRKDQSSLAT